MLFLNESFTNEGFQSNKLISCTPALAKTTLNVGNELVFLQVPDKSAIDHTFHYFTEAACESYRTMITWI